MIYTMYIIMLILPFMNISHVICYSTKGSGQLDRAHSATTECGVNHNQPHCNERQSGAIRVSALLTIRTHTLEQHVFRVPQGPQQYRYITNFQVEHKVAYNSKSPLHSLTPSQQALYILQAKPRNWAETSTSQKKKTTYHSPSVKAHAG